MLQASDFVLRRVQAVGYFRGTHAAPAAFIRHIPAEWWDLYDAEPVLVPLPEDASPDSPFLILRSTDQRQTLQVTNSRIDLVTECAEDPETQLGEVLRSLCQGLVSYAQTSGATYGRLAALAMRTAVSESPGRLLSRRFCREEWLAGPLNRPEGFELHAHKVYNLLEGVAVNSWMRVKTAKLGPGAYDHVLVQQDLNTLAEELEARDFAEPELSRWFATAGTEFGTILELYFPAGMASEGI